MLIPTATIKQNNPVHFQSQKSRSEYFEILTPIILGAPTFYFQCIHKLFSFFKEDHTEAKNIALYYEYFNNNPSIPTRNCLTNARSPSFSKGYSADKADISKLKSGSSFFCRGSKRRSSPFKLYS
jgi:hypothetical protein